MKTIKTDAAGTLPSTPRSAQNSDPDVGIYPDGALKVKGNLSVSSELADLVDSTMHETYTDTLPGGAAALPNIDCRKAILRGDANNTVDLYHGPDATVLNRNLIPGGEYVYEAPSGTKINLSNLSIDSIPVGSVAPRTAAQRVWIMYWD
jgi:hypothetical protein